MNVVNYVDYTVTNDEGEIDIQRNIGYALRDIDTIIFEASEIIGQPEPEYITIAHQQQSLRVFHPIKEEAVSDQVEQLSFNAVFDEIFDGRNQLFFSEFVDRRQNDATLALISLIGCIKGRHTLPKDLLLPSSTCEDVDKIH